MISSLPKKKLRFLPKRKTRINLLISLVSTFSSIILLEFIARFYLLLFPLPLDLWSFRRTQPPPYQSAPYFSQEFIDESYLEPGKWITPEGTNLVLPGNFRGKWFNVTNNRRVTTNQPQAAKTIYIFGGSTTYDSEVPDWYTMPSQFQRLVGLDYRVEN